MTNLWAENISCRLSVSLLRCSAGGSPSRAPSRGAARRSWMSSTAPRSFSLLLVASSNAAGHASSSVASRTPLAPPPLPRTAPASDSPCAPELDALALPCPRPPSRPKLLAPSLELLHGGARRLHLLLRGDPLFLERLESLLRPPPPPTPPPRWSAQVRALALQPPAWPPPSAPRAPREAGTERRSLSRRRNAAPRGESAASLVLASRALVMMSSRLDGLLHVLHGGSLAPS